MKHMTTQPANRKARPMNWAGGHDAFGNSEECMGRLFAAPARRLSRWRRRLRITPPAARCYAYHALRERLRPAWIDTAERPTRHLGVNLRSGPAVWWPAQLPGNTLLVAFVLGSCCLTSSTHGLALIFALSTHSTLWPFPFAHQAGRLRAVDVRCSYHQITSTLVFLSTSGLVCTSTLSLVALLV